jgi:chromosome segregation ATPase
MESSKMCRSAVLLGVWLCMGAAAMTLPASASAQNKIICWKDSSGKVIGCGDTVPPEFRSSGTKELDARGITRRTTESLDDAARRRAAENEQARARAEDGRRSAEQSRLDKALLDTYSSEAEIDLKRDRDLQVVDARIEQLKGALKLAAERHESAARRLTALESSKKAPPPALKDELARALANRERLDKAIAAAQAEKEELARKFAEYRKRYAELRSAASAPAAHTR